MGREVLGRPLRTLMLLAPALLLAVQTYFAASGIVYTLDDPYIHLTLARQIRLGHYGINPAEFAAPSSSILWPFLLAPFAFLASFELVPLAINLAALSVTLSRIARWLETFVSPTWATLATVAVAFCFNLYGLPFSGMEHSLQVMLVVVVALAVAEEKIAWPFWLSVILLPFIRYEGLAISLPTLLYLVVRPGHRLGAAIAALAILVGVGGFSAFLYVNDVGLLPASVMQRDAVSFSERFPNVGRIVGNIEALFYFLAIAAGAGALLARAGRGLAAVLLLAAPAAGQLAFGLYGDASRYQIYFQIWVAILFLSVYANTALARGVWVNLLLAAGLIAATSDAILVTLTSPIASRNIADQQGQMALIAGTYLDEPVAILDLGLVSLHSRQPILDLAGLASVEALRLRDDPNRQTWIPALMARHGVEHAIVDASEADRRPAGWIHVADLNLPLPCITPGSTDHVSFYSTNAAAAARMRAALVEYRKGSRERATVLVLSEDRAARATTQDACDRYLFPLNVNLLAKVISRIRYEIRQARVHAHADREPLARS